MKKRSRSVCYLMVLLFAVAVTAAQSQTTDADVMQKLKKAINPPASLGWDKPDPCKWGKVECANGRVTKIQVGKQGLTGSLPSNLGDLTALTIFEVMENGLTGPLPSLAGLGSLQRILVNGNGFTSIPSDFFAGMNSLDTVSLDNNPFTPWQLPESLKEASALRIFSAINCTISGSMPDIFNSSTFPSLTDLHLSFNSLSGELPSSFSDSLLQTLWLNGQQSDAKLNGTISVLQNMTGLKTVWLHSNSFSGPIPDLSGLGSLQDFSLRDNSLTGPVPDSLMKISSLQVVNLTNNMLQGPTPQFPNTVKADVVADTNSFCLSQPGKACDPRVNVLLAVAKDVGYPAQFAKDWKDNDPCTPWRGITCDKGEISVVNFQKMGLTGTISPNFSSITALQRLNLANNNLTGNIPKELTFLTQLQILDVSNNQLYGKLPVFDKKVKVITDGNVNIGKDGPPPGTKPPPGGTPSSPSGGKSEGGGKKSSSGAIVGAVVGGVCGIAALAGLFVFCLYRTKRKRSGRVQSPHTMVIHPRHSGSTDHDAVKITIAGSSANGGISETYSHGSSGPNDVHIIEAGSMMISIQVLKNVTNNFSQHNILGKGGFGTVYGGELHDGTKIAVKRMESGVMGEKGLEEFKSEIAVLTKVRHRHLVALLGYCLDGNERLLVYEYMPQGTLSRYLFDWKKEGLKPLEWMKRITIALDVARAVEYLHGLAQQSFIHRDLKPSNILLGDDMRAKVADFGLVRLAPDGKASIVTKLAGTFGYLAPEYAVTGRVTTKIDVFSFGVILMELITGRKALDESQPEECMHLVPWFRRMCVDIIGKDKGKDKDNDNDKEKEEKEKEAKFLEAIDPTIEVNEETLPSIKTVTELAGHCCARDPHQRPDMGHVVNALSSLAELWKPTEGAEDELYVLDYFESLPQAVKKWQALEGFSGFDGSSYLGSGDNTQTSIPTRPTGFAESFTSNDAR